MPMKILVGLRVLLLACLCFAAILSPAGTAHAIIGGQAVSGSSTLPVDWQVGLVASGVSAPAGQFCGGSLVDPSHVVTAAHCVVDTVSGVPVRPSTIDVVAGKSNLSSYPNGVDHELRVAVTQVSFSPQFDASSDDRDVALLTLGDDLLPSRASPIDPVTSADTIGTTGRISGWGAYLWDASTNTPTYPNTLVRADVAIHPDATCSTDWGAEFRPSTMLCAGGSVGDACLGDSGGPMATLVAGDWRLAGVISFGGEDCGDNRFPGVYTELAEPAIHAFLVGHPPAAPVGTTPVVTGTPQVGQTLTCNPGAWTGGASVDTQFVKTANGSTIALTAPGPNRSYTLTAADTWWQVVCLVKATNAGGWARARSAATAAIAAAPVITPTPAPTPAPAPAPTPTPTPTPRDVTAPKARVAKASCSRKRCVVDVTVTDRGYSAGVKGVVSSVTSSVKRSCRRHGRRTTCTRKVKRSLHAMRRSRGRYRVTMMRPARGLQRFAVIAVDRAGNRQLKPATRTVRVR